MSTTHARSVVCLLFRLLTYINRTSPSIRKTAQSSVGVSGRDLWRDVDTAAAVDDIAVVVVVVVVVEDNGVAAVVVHCLTQFSTSGASTALSTHIFSSVGVFGVWTPIDPSHSFPPPCMELGGCGTPAGFPGGFRSITPIFMSLSTALGKSFGKGYGSSEDSHPFLTCTRYSDLEAGRAPLFSETRISGTRLSPRTPHWLSNQTMN